MRFICGKFSTSFPAMGRSKTCKSMRPGTEIKRSDSPFDCSPVCNCLVLRFRNIFAVISAEEKSVKFMGIKRTNCRIFGRNSKERGGSVAIWLETRKTAPVVKYQRAKSQESRAWRKDELLRHVPIQNSRRAIARKQANDRSFHP